MSNQESVGERTPPITRRKFTLPEALDADIERLASRHYQGNVSRCLRAAVKDHQQTLDGEGRLALKRLEQQLGTLSETVSNQNQTPDESSNEPAAEGEMRAADGVPTVGAPAFGTAQGVLDELDAADVPLRVEDLLERMDFSKRQIITALGQLIDLGLILEQASDDRYTPVSNSVDDSAKIKND